MGDSLLDEMHARNRMYIVLVILLGVVITGGILYTQLPGSDVANEEEADDETTQKNETVTDTKKEEEAEKEQEKNDDTGTESEETKNETEKKEDLFDFAITSAESLDDRACYAPLEKVFEWFGAPLYEMGWETEPNGERGTPHSFKFFVWNSSIIFTKGKFNETTQEVHTHHYLSRESTNNSLEKLVDCKNPNKNIGT